MHWLQYLLEGSLKQRDREVMNFSFACLQGPQQNDYIFSSQHLRGVWKIPC